MLKRYSRKGIMILILGTMLLSSCIFQGCVEKALILKCDGFNITQKDEFEFTVKCTR